MPGIGQLIREIDVKESEIWESKETFFTQLNQNPRLSVKVKFMLRS